jgi:hypothetical protein
MATHFTGPVVSTAGFTGDVTGNVTGTVTGPVAATTVSASGVVSVANGTVGAPEVTFTSDTDTGLYRSSANVLGVAAGGLAVALFDANGVNAAVGGTTPAAVAATTVTASTSATIGGGTAITKVVVYTPSITPSSVSAATVAEQTFTVTGLTTADKVTVNPPAIGNATGIAGARVSASDTLAIRFVNPTAGSLTPSSGTYTVIAFRS